MSHAHQEPPDTEQREPWQPRFSIGTMLLVMAVCSVMFTSASYLVKAIRGDRNSQFAFILFTLVAPILLMMLVSGLLHLARWRRRPRR